MPKYSLTKEETDFLSPVLNDATKRSELFYSFGQKFLKKLSGIDLQKKTYALFEYLLENNSTWKGQLLIPPNYIQGEILQINCINYLIREYIGWSILYHNEVDTYFEFNEAGEIIQKQVPAMRLVDKDKYQMVKKVVKGKEVEMKVKKEGAKKLKAGFSLSQKDDILNIVIACFVEVQQTKNKDIEP